MAGSSVTFAQRHRDSTSSTKVTSSKKTTSRASVFDRLGSPTATTTQRTVTQEPPFRASPGRGALHRPYSDSRKKSEGPPVRIPAVQDGPSSSAEGRSVSRCSDDSDYSSAGNSFLVPETSGSVPRRIHPTVHRRSATADSRRHSVRGGDRDSSLPVKFSRAEILRAILVAKGCSREAAVMMTRSLRESSLHVYESQWVRFVFLL